MTPNSGPFPAPADPWQRVLQGGAADRPARPLVCVVVPCFNEERNVGPLVQRLQAVFERLADQAQFELLFIDNASTDATVARIEALIAQDARIGLIVNLRNYGHVRSPVHALLQARGDAVIGMAADLQDPPELIEAFLVRWRQGAHVVAGVKAESEESGPRWWLRSQYYRLLQRLSSVELVEHFTGFGLYDRRVIEALRLVGDQYPYVRGLVSELGFAVEPVPYVQPLRKEGRSKNNFASLFDLAMLGMTSHSRAPLRIATMLGFLMSAVSLLVSLGYLLAKLLMWEQFSLGMAPLLIGVFFFGSVQLFFIGLLGEYLGAVHGQVHRRPLVLEKRRVNVARAEE